MSKVYVQSYYDGSLFQYSKTKQEGFVEHTNTVGKTSYRKYFNKGVEGVLQEVKKRNNQYLNNREELEFILQKGETEYHINFPILENDGGSIDSFVESVTRVLPNMKIGETYNINNWRLNKGDEINGEIVEYTNQGVAVKQDGKKLDFALSYQTDKNPKGDIPKLEWKEIAGKNRPTAVSKENRLNFLYDTLTNEVGRLSGGDNQPKQSTPEPSAPKATPQSAIDDTDDDLPF